MKKFVLLLLIILSFQSANAQNTLDKIGLTATTPAAVAYSLRLLSNSYSGPLVRIKVGSNYYDVYPDNVNFEFDLTSKISAAYSTYNANAAGITTNALSSVISSNDATVAVWYDQSGNARDLSQSSISKQPTIISRGNIYKRNGKPVIYHDGSDDGLFFSGSNYLSTNPLSVNIIAGSNANVVTARRAVQGTNNWLIGPYNNQHSWYASGWNHQINEPWSTTSLEVFTVIQPASNANTSFRNGANQTSGNNKGTPNKIQTGTEGSYAEPLNGFINEILAFNSEVSTTTRKTFEGNQSTNYGICLLNTQPSSTNQSVIVGGTASALNVLSDDLTATYQWYSNTVQSSSGGTIISGATGTSYTPNTSVEGTLYYYAVITTATNTCSSKVSGFVRVGIEITVQPSKTNQTIIQNNSSTALSVTTTGTNLTYQWYKNSINSNTGGTLITGANSSNYSPPTTDLGTNYYYVTVSGNNTLLTSNTSGFVRVTTTPVIWNGPTITFSKSDYANTSISSNQDIILSTVKITRGDDGGLFNIASQGNFSGSVPSNTEWARGSLANYASLTYGTNWRSVMSSCPPCQIGNSFVVHLINENIYLELTLTSWTDGANGGGFSYTRTTNPSIAPTISNFSNLNKYYFDNSFTLTAPTSNSAGAFSYSSSNTAVATISGTTVNIVAPGTTTITATQAANAGYQSGTITATLTINSVNSVTKNGAKAATNPKYVNRNGALGGSKAVKSNGEIVTNKSAGNGLTASTASTSAYAIKQAYPSSTDGLYWISNPNINGGTPFQIYADMTTDGGGWTLILCNASNAGWTYANAISLNTSNPSINSNYSIIAYADYIKKSTSGFQYMIDANTRRSNGAIWTANQAYTFLKNNNTQTDITINTKFGTWTYHDGGIEQIMPWYSNCSGYITTSSNCTGGSWWGTLVSQSGWSPAPWINGGCGTEGCAPNPGIIWYWVR